MFNKTSKQCSVLELVAQILDEFKSWVKVGVGGCLVLERERVAVLSCMEWISVIALFSKLYEFL
jgi:hypothetical protein